MPKLTIVQEKHFSAVILQLKDLIEDGHNHLKHFMNTLIELKNKVRDSQPAQCLINFQES